jgi:hypothetical protein
MDANIRLLREAKGIDCTFNVVKAGEFSHRHKRNVQDKHQCMLRQHYVDMVPDGEWFMVLDSDELIFGALDRIGDVLNWANAQKDIVQWMGISEALPDWTTTIRPRIIKKVKGLVYGGIPNHEGIKHKHDVIAHMPSGKNWIDIANKTNSWIIDFLGFFHYKNGIELELYSKDRVIEMPPNMIKLEDLEKIADSEGIFTIEGMEKIYQEAEKKGYLESKEIKP